MRTKLREIMRNVHSLALLLIAVSFGCGDGCSCGSAPEAPVVPESAGGTEAFESVTTGASAAAPPVAEAEELVVELEPLADDEGSVEPELVPHQLDPNQQIQALQPPRMQLHPVTPGRGGNLPNRVSPLITNQRVRQAGPTPGSVDPDFVTE
jgi:hypothetical protein